MLPIILSNKTIDTLNQLIIKDKTILRPRTQELSPRTQEPNLQIQEPNPRTQGLSPQTQDRVETIRLQATTLVRLRAAHPEAITQLQAQVLLAALTLLPALQAAVLLQVLLARLVHQDLQAHQAALVQAVAVADNY